ncbi:MAG: hypothetical protein Q7S56_01430 [Nanoarchaeota archaeon]|nr:hypothetical protein [Nanoarchaeota archaeon]
MEMLYLQDDPFGSNASLIQRCSEEYNKFVKGEFGGQISPKLWTYIHLMGITDRIKNELGESKKDLLQLTTNYKITRSAFKEFSLRAPRHYQPLLDFLENELRSVEDKLRVEVGQDFDLYTPSLSDLALKIEKQ